MERKYLAMAIGILVVMGGLFLLANRSAAPVGGSAAGVDPGLAAHGASDGAASTDPVAVLAAADRRMTVYKDPNCGCCGKWVDHVTAAGYEAAVENTADLVAIKDRLGVPSSLRSCHTAIVGDYVFEGHVPADVIDRFLAEKPEGAVGLAVPGMPIGSPGMEMGGRTERYDVMVFDADGNARVYASR